MFQISTIHALAIIVAMLAMTTLAGNANAETLVAEDIKSQVVGKTLVAKRMGMTMHLSIKPDGSVVAKSALMNGEGTWEIKGDQLCINIANRPGNRNPCQTFTRTGENTLESSTGMKFTLQ